MSNSVLVIGASQAGVQLAASLRELGHDGAITLVGAEPHLPYQRPPLSKAYLAGVATAQSLALRNDAFYASHDIDLLRGDRVESIDLEGGKATTESGLTLPFDRLALTTGARVIRLHLPGAQLPGVLYLRDLDDADMLARVVPSARSVVVVGGGFIGLEAAAVCRNAGKDVTVVEMGSRLAARAVAPVVSDFYRQAHERRGTTIRLGRTVTEMLGDKGAVAAVRLDDGDVLPADLVLVGVGVAPRIELAEQIGLETRNRAIVVDSFARTSDPRVVAAGDCTLLPHPRGGDEMVRLESVQNAVDQAKVAAATLVGKQDPYSAVPWFWSDQDTLKLKIAGLSTGYDDVVVRGDPETEKFSVLYYKSGKLLALDSVNQTPDYLVARRLLGAGGTVPPERAADVDTPLKSLAAADE